MELSFTDADQWYEVYEAATPREQYEIMRQTVSQPLTQKFIDDLDLGMALLEVNDQLINNNLIDDALELLSLVQKNLPVFYRKEFAYLDSFAVEYSLFKNEPEQMRLAMTNFIAQPARDLDLATPVLLNLIYYGFEDLVIEFSAKGYRLISRSGDYIGGAESVLFEHLFGHHLERFYQNIREGRDTWAEFLRVMRKYDVKEENLDDLKTNLIRDIRTETDLDRQFEQNRAAFLELLQLGFCKYMLEEKQIHFLCSIEIWKCSMGFLGKSAGKRSDPDKFFWFNKQKLDEYITETYFGMMTKPRCAGVAGIWGMVYLYDFLLALALITPETHRHALTQINLLKADFNNVMPNRLWLYDFVHRWMRPDSVSDEEFARETELFRSSFEKKTPLAVTPSSPKSMGNILENLAAMLLADDAPVEKPNNNRESLMDILFRGTPFGKGKHKKNKAKKGQKKASDPRRKGKK